MASEIVPQSVEAFRMRRIAGAEAPARTAIRPFTPKRTDWMIRRRGALRFSGSGCIDLRVRGWPLPPRVTTARNPAPVALPPLPVAHSRITITVDANEARTAGGGAAGGGRGLAPRPPDGDRAPPAFEAAVPVPGVSGVSGVPGVSVVELLSAKWDRVEVCHLDVGDFSLSGRVVIERKTVSDLVVSLRDGRLFRQAYRLNRGVARPVVIVEGDESELRRAIPRDALRGVMLSLAVGYRIPVLRTATLDETVETIVHIAAKETKRFGRPTPSGWRPTIGDGVENHGGQPDPAPVESSGEREARLARERAARELIDVLCAVPGVGRVRAEAIAMRVGGLGDVARVGLRELMAVPGVGPGTAVRIHEALHALRAV